MNLRCQLKTVSGFTTVRWLTALADRAFIIARENLSVFLKYNLLFWRLRWRLYISFSFLSRSRVKMRFFLFLKIVWNIELSRDRRNLNMMYYIQYVQYSKFTEILLFFVGGWIKITHGDTFSLLLLFIRDKELINAEILTLEDFSHTLIKRFIAYIEQERAGKDSLLPLWSFHRRNTLCPKRDRLKRDIYIAGAIEIAFQTSKPVVACRRWVSQLL